MRVGLLLLGVAVLGGTLIGCGEPADEQIPEVIELLPVETFDWCAQPIRFQPPPEAWYRDKLLQAGLRGVHFVHAGSVGERIDVAEYYSVGRRSELEGGYRRYRLADVVGKARWKPEHYSIVDSVWGGASTDTTVASLLAERVDFGMANIGHQYVGREYYVLKGNYLFVASYLGLAENLPLFEQVVTSIEFPQPVSHWSRAESP